MYQFTMLACLILLGNPAADPDEKRELQNLQGVWKTRAPQEHLVFTLVIVGDTYTFSSQVGKLKLDPANHSCDLTIEEGFYKGKTVPGLYELDGDVLRIAMGLASNPMGRPTNLQDDPDKNHRVYVFNRDDMATKEQAAELLKERTEVVIKRAQDAARRAPVTQEAFQQLLDKLEKIEKRLDALEKKSDKK